MMKRKWTILGAALLMVAAVGAGGGLFMMQAETLSQLKTELEQREAEVAAQAAAIAELKAVGEETIGRYEARLREQSDAVGAKEKELADRDRIIETQNARYATVSRRLDEGMKQMGVGAGELWAALRVPETVGSRTTSVFGGENPLFRIAFWEADVDVDYVHTTAENEMVALHALYRVRYGLSAASRVELCRSSDKLLKLTNMPVDIVSCSRLPKTQAVPEGIWNHMSEAEFARAEQAMDALALRKGRENTVALERARRRLVSLMNLAPDIMSRDLTVVAE